MKKVGLIVNPVAGMGGSVGLKGTDGEMYSKAIEMGASPVTPLRAAAFLSNLKHRHGFMLLAGPGKMGEDVARDSGIEYRVLSSIDGETVTADDTRRIGREMSDEADLIVFVGGDGTARDICDAVGMKTPVIGVPSGVKMFGSVFAVNAVAAAEIVDSFLEGDTGVSEKEVLDIDEEAYRQGRLDSRLYGYLRVPEVTGLVQSGKEATVSNESSQENQAEIARYIIEDMEEEVLYLLGAGTTTAAIAKMLGLEKTLLGVDAIYNHRLVADNLNEKKMLELIGHYPRVKIIISPIGGNAFIFGRGNQEFSPAVLKRVRRDDIVVVATRDKMKGVLCLRVDTNDSEVDGKLRGFMRVVTHYNEEVLIEVA
ncbi:MAG: ATP-NAD kinase family protein [Dehalococcoidales bacterium]